MWKKLCGKFLINQMRRKLLFGAIVQISIIYVLKNLGLLLTIFIVSFLFILWLICFLRHKEILEYIDEKTIIICFLCCILGFASYFSFNQRENDIVENEFPNKFVEVTGRIQDVYKKEGKNDRVVLNITKVSGESLNNIRLKRDFKAIVTFKSSGRFNEDLGKEIKFIGILKRPKTAGNPHSFDYREFLRSKKIFWIGEFRSYKVTIKNQGVFYKTKNHLFKMREKFFENFGKNKKINYLFKAIVFGEKYNLKEEDYDDFQRNGIAHILAVSGLHIGFLFTFYKLIYKKISSTWVSLGFMIVLLFYGTITLWSVSATRAIFMTLICLIGEKYNKRYDLLSSLSLVSILILANNPYELFSPGYIMSFLALASIGFLYPLLRGRVPKGMDVILAVQGGLIPYIAYTFNYISFGGFILNIPVIFLVSLLVPIGIISFFLEAIGINGEIIYKIMWGLTYQIDRINLVGAKYLPLNLDVISPSELLILSIYLLGFFISSELFFVLYNRKKFKIIGICLMSIIIIIGTTYISEDYNKNQDFLNATIVFLDVGQGDSTHIRSKNGANILIDGGGSRNFNMGKKTLKPYFLKSGIKSLDIGAITHWDMDHSLGIEQLIEIYPVEKIFAEGELGDKLILDNINIEILWPKKRNTSCKGNDNSLVYKAEIDGLTILITGDISGEVERTMIEYYKGTEKLKSTVLKVSHHGSKESTKEEFIKEVIPKVALIGVGKNNYGHPWSEVIDKLEKNDIIVLRTDLFGAIGISLKNDNLVIKTNRQGDIDK